MAGTTFARIAEDFHLGGDRVLAGLLEQEGNLELELATARRDARQQIRKLLRAQGIIADSLADLTWPKDGNGNAYAGAWQELDSQRKPRQARFTRDDHGIMLVGDAYFCENGCGWVAQKYPSAPMIGWSPTTLDAASSRPCVVCDLPVGRTPDIAYAAGSEMRLPPSRV